MATDRKREDRTLRDRKPFARSTEIASDTLHRELFPTANELPVENTLDKLLLMRKWSLDLAIYVKKQDF